MSFSSEAKAELCQQRPDKKCCALAESYGVLLYCNTFSAQEIRIITASPEFAARLPRLFKRAFGLSFDILPKEGTAGKSTTQNGTNVCSFRIAVDRSFTRQGEERKADFIDVTAWRQTAEFVSKYFQKGSMIAIEGSLQTTSYQDKNGNNRTKVEVVASNVKKLSAH